jgi:hypothetical protein
MEASDLLKDALRLLNMPSVWDNPSARTWLKHNGKFSPEGVRYGFSLFDGGYSTYDVAVQMGIWPRKAFELFKMWKREQRAWTEFKA